MSAGKFVRVEDAVYCHQLDEVHPAGVNPYGMGPESWCDPAEHRTVYYRSRKGDVESGQPAP